MGPTLREGNTVRMKFVSNRNARHDRLVLLAPAKARIPDTFTRVAPSSDYHEHLLLGAQRLRAKVYAEDGALRASEISPDGLHLHPADDRAWHLLSLDGSGAVRGCSRYVAHPNTVHFSELGIRKAALAQSPEWGTTLRAAIAAEVAEARRRRLAYVEVGGWALDTSIRGSAEAVRIALATYSLARVLGGCIGVTNATRRHCSAAILRKIGGDPLQIDQIALPSYYDPQYDCEMEMLRFDSSRPNPRFEPWIEDLRLHLTGALVVQATNPIEGRLEESRHTFETLETFEWSREAWRLGRDLAHTVQ